MKLLLVTAFASTALASGALLAKNTTSFTPQPTLNSVSIDEDVTFTFFDEFADWKRPSGPPKVALQVGHWKNGELPDEFENLRRTGGGASAAGTTEWEVNLAIAQEAASLLREDGIEVEILPATVPPGYWADVFISIHADGNKNSNVSGYKVAAPWRDRTGKAARLTQLLEQEYGKTVNIEVDPNITRNMRGYYAFNWRRYEHSMHPMSTAAIFETGFLTSPHDRQIIVAQPELAAQGIVNGIKAFFEELPPQDS